MSKHDDAINEELRLKGLSPEELIKEKTNLEKERKENCSTQQDRHYKEAQILLAQHRATVTWGQNALSIVALISATAIGITQVIRK